MTRKLYTAVLAVLMLFGAVAVVSCGTATSPATLTTTPPATSVTGATAAVVIENYAYSPAAITVGAGTIVTWTNKDSMAHTVTTRAPLFDSGLISKDKSFSYTFNQKGEYEYYCIPHPYMTGKVTVE